MALRARYAAKPQTLQPVALQQTRREHRHADRAGVQAPLRHGLGRRSLLGRVVEARRVP